MKNLINDIKTGFKLVKYGIQYKQMVFFSIIFCLIGVAFIIFGGPTQIMLGMVYLSFCISYFIQPYMSTSIASVVRSSPIHRAMFINVPVTVNTISANVGYILGVIVLLIKLYVLNGFTMHGNEQFTVSQIALVILASGIISLGMQVYVIACYKYFLASMLVFFFAFFGSYMALNEIFRQVTEFNLNLVVAIVAGYVCIWAGSGLSYLTAKLCYRKALDPMYYKRALANGLK